MFLTVIYTRFSHIINYFALLIITLHETAIAFFSLPFVLLLLLCCTSFIYWIAFGMHRLALQVLRSSYCGYGSCGKKDSSWHTKSATLRRDVATTSLLHPTLHWKSDFLLFGPEIGSRGSPSHHRGRDEDVRLIGDTRV